MKSKNSKKTTTTKTQQKKEEEYFTKEEEKRIDKIHEKTGHKFDDDEVYELMQKYKNNDEAVINELNERGETHEWEDIGKGN
jgi:hypothetical protein